MQSATLALAVRYASVGEIRSPAGPRQGHSRSAQGPLPVRRVPGT